jgi:hypothetical protein
MRGLWVLLVIAGATCGATDDWRAALDRVRENVARQVGRSANYTCVETVDRTTFRSARDLLRGCAYESKTPERKEVSHDRLRLDVAVSQGKEIFAWHGQERFSGSSGIDDVVQRGAVSSGGFIGFLENIFTHKGIRFTYTGEGVINGAHTYSFDYVVPLASSGYHVGTRHGRPAIPFHGSFSVRAPEFQLVTLSIIADEIPENSHVCSAETEMIYQMAKISGQDALIPSQIMLRIGDVDHEYSVSRSEYSGCRAYSAESTLRFDTNEAAPPISAGGPSREEQLPAGTILRIGLRTAIDDEVSYAGDPVEGVLLNAVKVKGTHIVIPKNTAVRGVVTLLEKFEAPVEHYLISIQFGQLSFERTKYVFRAGPAVSRPQAKKLTEIYKGPWPDSIQEIYDRGLFVFRAQHVHLDGRFSGDWITRAPEEPLEGRAAIGAR